MSDTEVTELVTLDASRVDAVFRPANGTPWILLKAAEESEAEEQEDEMTKAEADEIERLLTKSGLASSFCGDFECPVCKSAWDEIPAALVEKAKLKAKQRRALPDSAFALPEKRAYPIQDESHARVALSMLHNASPAEQKKIKAAVHRRYPDIEIGGEDKAEKSPGVPDFATETPREHGHLDSGQSGLAGPATGGIKPLAATPSAFPGGESTYVAVAESEANPGHENGSGRSLTPGAHVDIPGRDVGKSYVSTGFLSPDESLYVAVGKIPGHESWSIEVVEKENWIALDKDAPSGEASAEPGSGPWEQYDGATLDHVASGLAAMHRAVDQIRRREVAEAVSGDPNDWFDAFKLDCAGEDITDALGLVAALAYHEAAAGRAEKAGRVISAKTGAKLRAARDHLNELLGEGPQAQSATGARPSEEEDIMTTVTKEELAQFIGTSAKQAVRDELKARDKAAKTAAKKEAKKARAKARKNSPGNDGDITEAEERRTVGAGHDADDVNSIPDGGHVDSMYRNKARKGEKDKVLKALAAQQQQTLELMQKMASRPRQGGPVLDGQLRGAFAAAEGRSGSATKGGEDPEIATLQKQLDDELAKPGPEAAHRASDISQRLTLARLRYAHENGLA